LLSLGGMLAQHNRINATNISGLKHEWPAPLERFENQMVINLCFDMVEFTRNLAIRWRIPCSE
jgi:hypothetical protein